MNIIYICFSDNILNIFMMLMDISVKVKKTLEAC